MLHPFLEIGLVHAFECKPFRRHGSRKISGSPVISGQLLSKESKGDTKQSMNGKIRRENTKSSETKMHQVNVAPYSNVNRSVLGMEVQRYYVPRRGRVRNEITT